MQDFQFIVSAGILIGFGLLEIVRGRFFSPLASREDNRLDLAVTVLFPVISISVLFASMTLAAQLLPEARGSLAHWPWYAMLGVLLLADDLTQYWWHRLSHTSFLWPLHRAHHSAAYMSVRIVYRNNAFYYAMMPGLWLSGLLIYLGFGSVYVGYAIVKLAVIIGAHSSVRWDEKLYSIPALSPVMWVVERTISTPATHYAHHALSQDDGIGHYRGNYGNLLFIWDMIFGTAVITRRYPPAFGLADDLRHGPERWWTQFLYPIFRSRRAASSLSVPPTPAP